MENQYPRYRFHNARVYTQAVPDAKWTYRSDYSNSDRKSELHQKALNDGAGFACDKNGIALPVDPQVSYPRYRRLWGVTYYQSAQGEAWRFDDSTGQKAVKSAHQKELNEGQGTVCDKDGKPLPDADADYARASINAAQPGRFYATLGAKRYFRRDDDPAWREQGMEQLSAEDAIAKRLNAIRDRWLKENPPKPADKPARCETFGDRDVISYGTGGTYYRNKGQLGWRFSSDGGYVTSTSQTALDKIWAEHGPKPAANPPKCERFMDKDVITYPMGGSMFFRKQGEPHWRDRNNHVLTSDLKEQLDKAWKEHGPQSIFSTTDRFSVVRGRGFTSVSYYRLASGSAHEFLRDEGKSRWRVFGTEDFVNAEWQARLDEIAPEIKPEHTPGPVVANAVDRTGATRQAKVKVSGSNCTITLENGRQYHWGPTTGFWRADGTHYPTDNGTAALLDSIFADYQKQIAAKTREAAVDKAVAQLNDLVRPPAPPPAAAPAPPKPVEDSDGPRQDDCGPPHYGLEFADYGGYRFARPRGATRWQWADTRNVVGDGLQFCIEQGIADKYRRETFNRRPPTKETSPMWFIIPIIVGLSIGIGFGIGKSGTKDDYRTTVTVDTGSRTKTDYLRQLTPVVTRDPACPNKLKVGVRNFTGRSIGRVEYKLTGYVQGRSSNIVDGEGKIVSDLIANDGQTTSACADFTLKPSVPDADAEKAVWKATVTGFTFLDDIPEYLDAGRVAPWSQPQCPQAEKTGAISEGYRQSYNDLTDPKLQPRLALAMNDDIGFRVAFSWKVN